MSNGVYYPPVLHNGTTNSIYNNTDWVINGNDAKYVKLSGSTMTGGLSAVGLTSTGGINQLMSNLTLPTTYSSAPNSAVPSNPIGRFDHRDVSFNNRSVGNYNQYCYSFVDSGNLFVEL